MSNCKVVTAPKCRARTLTKEKSAVSLGLKQRKKIRGTDRGAIPAAKVKTQDYESCSYGAFVELEEGVEGLIHHVRTFGGRNESCTRPIF